MKKMKVPAQYKNVLLIKKSKKSTTLGKKGLTGNYKNLGF